MNAALGFQPASELPPSSSREQELEGIIKRQSEQLEKLQDELSAPSIRPDELQKLIILLNTFDGRIRELEGEVERQAIQIDDLWKEAKANVQEVYEVHDMARTIIGDACKRITALEEGPDLSENETAQAHVEELYEHMEAIGRKQVSFKEASRCLKLSKSRTLQLKTALALDERFIIVPSETHKQKKLIRLRKYYVGVDAHKTA